MDTIRINHGKRLSKRPFLPPFAVAVVFLVFIGLIVVMGVMNIQRIDKALTEFVEERALSIAGIVQNLAQENLNNLVQASRIERESSTPRKGVDVFSPKQLLVTALFNIGREVDNHWRKEKLDEGYLNRYASERGIFLIAIFDRKGRVVIQSRELSKEYLKGAHPTLVESGKLSMTLIEYLGATQRIGFVALKRKDGSGTVVIALDPEGLRFWGIKVSVEKAISELGESSGQGLYYFVVIDQKGKLISASGSVPGPWHPEDLQVSEVMAGLRRIDSRKVIYLGKPIFDVVVPLYLNGQIAGVVRMGLDREDTEKILEDNKKNIFANMGIITLIAFVSLWFLYHTQNKHLESIVAMERQLEKAERLSALGQLAAGLAHEIRNPLNAISMATQRLKREFMGGDELKNKEIQELLFVVRDEIRRLNGIVEEFLSFSRSRRLEFREFPLAELLQKIVNLMSEEAAVRGIVLKTKWEDDFYIPMDVDKLQQAFLNFIKNSIESMSDGGEVSLEIARERKGWVTVRIADTGCGISPEELEKIFSPEYTTKDKGFGLGLCLAHEIVRGHGGEIRVTSEKGKGSIFEIHLPEEKVNLTASSG
ncbi:MAG: ATP-binding protein [Syntrophales bacterium]|nr:ATP-binding protein [Syntrophales bacterium]